LAQRTILIVGGGVIGLSIAEALSRRGVHPIVLEKGEIGMEASWAGAGFLSFHSAVLSGGPLQELAEFSFHLYKSWVELLKQDSGVEVGFRDGASFEVAFDDEEVARLRDLYTKLQSRRVDVRWKEGAEVREAEDELSTEVMAAMAMPTTGRVQTTALMKALATLLGKRGVSLREHTPVSGFLIEGGRLRGVKTPHEDIQADAVVLASGAWSGSLGEKLGLKLPIRPLRAQVTMFSSERLDLQSVIVTPTVTLVPRGEGHYHVSTSVEDVGFNKNTTLQGVERIETGAYRAVPALRLGKMESRWAGLMSGTPDGLPFLGPAPGLEGLYLACGHFDQGFLLAPATGLLLDQALRGEESDVSLEPFAANRPMQGSLGL